jgi:hypothetical protein
LRIVVHVLLWLVLGATALGHAARALAEEPGERPFERCLEAGSGAAMGTAWIELAASDGGDAVSHSRARLSWSEGEGELRIRLEMLAPKEVAGSAILLVEPTTAVGAGEASAWAYLPEIGQVRRVGGRHLRKPLFGTNLSYADLDRVRQIALRGQTGSWSEDDYAGRPVWRIDAHQGSTQVTTWLDRERCVPLRTEVEDGRGRLLRLVQVSAEPAAGDASAFVPARIVVRDVRADSETRVQVEAVDLVAVPPEASFDPAFLADPVSVPASLEARSSGS